MSKGQKSNREIKKPKQQKVPAVPVSTSSIPLIKKPTVPATSKIK